MSESKETFFKMDKGFLQVTSFDDDSNEVDFWRAMDAEKRLAAVEHLRESLFGYEHSTQRLQRFFEIIDCA